MLNGFAAPSRIFGLAFKLKKSGEKNLAYFLICFKVEEEVFEITLFYGTASFSRQLFTAAVPS